MAAIAPLLSIAGTLVSAVGTIAAGNAQNAAAKYEAAQYDQHATEERAAAQRESMQYQKKTDLMLSRQQALAAGSGFDALSPSFVNLAGDTAAYGEYQARTAQYGGDMRGNALNAKAAGLRMSGQAAQTAGYIGAAGTILGGATDWFTKYGQGGPNTDPFANATSAYYG